MAEFESSDLYFQPDDPAVWNPEKFSPQQRLRNFLPKWPTHYHHNKHHHHHHHSRSSTVKYHNSLNSATATRYLLAATGDHTTTFLPASVPPPLHPEWNPLFSESLDSLTQTSYSSEGAAQQVKEYKEVNDDYHHDYHDDADVESCCGSLTYSVESERHVHQYYNASNDHHYYFPQHSVLTIPPDDVDVYQDAVETLDDLDTFKSPPHSNGKKKKKNSSVNNNNCFQPGDCFHPFAWIGKLFGGPKSVLVSTTNDDDDDCPVQ